MVHQYQLGLALNFECLSLLSVRYSECLMMSHRKLSPHYFLTGDPIEAYGWNLEHVLSGCLRRHEDISTFIDVECMWTPSTYNYSKQDKCLAIFCRQIFISSKVYSTDEFDFLG